MTEPSRIADRVPASSPRRGRMLAVGIAAAAVAGVLWSVREDRSRPPPDAFPPRGAPIADSETRFAAALSSAPTTARPLADRPAAVAEIVARLLSGTPDLDPQHLPAMIDRALDPAPPLGDRLGAIRWLARLGNDEAVDVLERLLLRDASAPIRVAVAMALGECSHPDAVRILTSLLDDDDMHVVLGAIRGLASQREPGATGILEALVADASLRDEVRSEAAAALGSHDGVSAALRDVFAQAEGDLAAGALEGLGRQPFRETEDLFRPLLGDPDVSVDVKLAAIEALADSTPDAAGFLLEVAGTANDPDLRSAAIDALALFEGPGDTLGGLGALVRTEPSADVRADLYSTLAFHAREANVGPDSRELVHSALAETAPRAQLEGYRMVAGMLHQQYRPETADAFDGSMVAWLQGRAERGPDRYTRKLSMDALALAGTPGAREALLDLSHSTDPSVSQSAEKALRIAASAGASHAP